MCVVYTVLYVREWVAQTSFSKKPAKQPSPHHYIYKMYKVINKKSRLFYYDTRKPRPITNPSPFLLNRIWYTNILFPHKMYRRKTIVIQTRERSMLLPPRFHKKWCFEF